MWKGNIILHKIWVAEENNILIIFSRGCVILFIFDDVTIVVINLMMIKEFIVRFIQVLARVLGYIPAVIYGYVYSEYFTK